jgi:hypothetical protein
MDEYHSPFPECRVTATTEPHAMIRVDINDDMAGQLARDVLGVLEDTSEFPFEIPIDMRAIHYRQLHELLPQVARTEQMVSKQLVIADQPTASVAIMLGRSQVRDLAHKLDHVVEEEPDVWRWLVPLSNTGCVMLIQQLRAVLEGYNEPLDHVDQDGALFERYGGADV